VRVTVAPRAMCNLTLITSVKHNVLWVFWIFFKKTYTLVPQYRPLSLYHGLAPQHCKLCHSLANFLPFVLLLHSNSRTHLSSFQNVKCSKSLLNAPVVVSRIVTVTPRLGTESACCGPVSEVGLVAVDEHRTRV
jgi:hypothetical protein